MNLKHPSHRKLLLSAIYVVGVFLLFSAIAHSQDATPEGESTPEVVLQDCAECHIDVVSAWQGSPHSMSFIGDAFQTAWTNSKDNSCLACHTTGYTPFNGEFTHSAVTCEACHGQTPLDHPDEPLTVTVAAEACAECHTTTYHEWSASPHGEQQLACTTCHNPHPQEVRFGDNTALCVNCHEEAASVGYAHITHTEQECTDCHWHRGEFDQTQHITTGLLVSTGHSALVETLSCTTCHQSLAEDMSVDAVTGTQHEVSSQRLYVQELQADVENAIALGENTSAVRLIQGLVVGLAIGGILTILFLRLNPQRHLPHHESDEQEAHHV